MHILVTAISSEELIKKCGEVIVDDNLPYYVMDANAIPDEVDDLLLRYCILNYDLQNEVDFVFSPLYYLDLFPRPAADLRIGPYRLQVPLDWSIVIGDKNMGNMEIIEIRHLNDRDFDAFCFNPFTGYMPSFHEVTIENIFPDVSWTLPKLKHGHILAAPLSREPDAPCVFLVRDTNKLPEVLDITKIIP